MGKYLFVMPWGSMELDIEEDAQGLHVVMTSPERNMTVVPEVAERPGRRDCAGGRSRRLRYAF